MKNTTTALALAVLAAAPAVAGERSFPGARDSWSYAVQAPGAAGLTRFSYLNATPIGAGRWSVSVACGQHVARTGREVSRHEATGTAERGHMAAIGGTFALGGGPPSAFLIDLGDTSDALRLRAQFTDTRCASGWGDLSAGD